MLRSSEKPTNVEEELGLDRGNPLSDDFTEVQRGGEYSKGGRPRCHQLLISPGTADFTTSQPHNLTTSQPHNLTTSQSHNLTTSQRHNIISPRPRRHQLLIGPGTNVQQTSQPQYLTTSIPHNIITSQSHNLTASQPHTPSSPHDLTTKHHQIFMTSVFYHSLMYIKLFNVYHK